ncbi:MAG: hypothetical protein Kow0075_01480 [Salibacteraceae bacterium]
MKTSTKLTKTAAILAMAAIGFTSCKKTVTGKKLDGEWDVVSGLIESEYSYQSGNSTYTTTTTQEFDGSELETTTVTNYNGTTSTTITTDQMSISYTFDRKAGTYVMTRIANEEYIDDYGSYYTYDANTNSYQYTGYYERTVMRTSTTTESGFFTITGDAGEEIEKYSQIVFQPNMMVVDYTDEYSYEDASTGATLSPNSTYEQGAYNPNTGEYAYNKVPASASGTESYEGRSYLGTIWNVTELDKDMMMVEYTDDTIYENSEDDDANYTQTTHASWTLNRK